MTIVILRAPTAMEKEREEQQRAKNISDFISDWHNDSGLNLSVAVTNTLKRIH